MPGIYIGNMIAKGSGSRSWTHLISAQSVQPATLEQVSITLKADIAGAITIDFGDGVGARSLTGNGHDEVHTSQYSSINTTYNISLAGNLQYLKKFQCANNATLNLNINSFEKTGLEYLDLDTLGGTITGDLGKLSNYISYLKIKDCGALITGSLNDTKLSGLASLYLDSTTLVTGVISGLSTYLIDLLLDNIPLVTGALADTPRKLKTLYLVDTGAITGNLSGIDFTQLQTFHLVRYGVGVSGNIELIVTTVTDFQTLNKMYSYHLEPTTETDVFTGSMGTVHTNNPNAVTHVLLKLGANVTA